MLQGMLCQQWVHSGYNRIICAITRCKHHHIRLIIHSNYNHSDDATWLVVGLVEAISSSLVRCSVLIVRFSTSGHVQHTDALMSWLWTQPAKTTRAENRMQKKQNRTKAHSEIQVNATPTELLKNQVPRWQTLDHNIRFCSQRFFSNKCGLCNLKLNIEVVRPEDLQRYLVVEWRTLQKLLQELYGLPCCAFLTPESTLDEEAFGPFSQKSFTVVVESKLSIVCWTLLIQTWKL